MLLLGSPPFERVNPHEQIFTPFVGVAPSTHAHSVGASSHSWDDMLTSEPPKMLAILAIVPLVVMITSH